MEYAIVEFQGKQHKLEPGKALTIDSLGLADGQTVELTKVLFYKHEDTVTVGTPYIKDFTIIAKVTGSSKGQKIRVLRFRAKSKYRKVTGHRQVHSTIVATSLSSTPKPNRQQKA